MLVLPTAVSIEQASDALAMLAQALPREPADRVSVDASGLQQFDSSVLSVLLECRRLAQASGRGFAIRGAAPRLAQLARLHGVEALFAATGDQSPATAA